MMLVRTVVWLIFAVLLAPVRGAENEKLLDLLNSSPSLTHAHIGWKFIEADTSKVLAEHEASNFFTPASNTKLYTTAAALVRLGVTYQFKTVVKTMGTVDAGGTLRGDLIFVGGGDPNLSGRMLPYTPDKHEEDPLAAVKRLADQIQSRGIRQVQGDVIGDDTRYPFDPYPDGWTVDDATWYYGTPVSAFSVNDNSVQVTVLPTQPGKAADIQLDPEFGYFVVLNHVTTDESAAAHVEIARPPGSNELILSGTIGRTAPKVEEYVAVADPALFASLALKAQLEERGISVHGTSRAQHRSLLSVANPLEEARVVSAPEGTVLASLDSAPLYQIVQVVNKVSQNLHAEMLLRETALATRGIGTLAAALEERTRFLAEAGIDDTAFDFADGSGLARQDLTTPASTVQLLRYMWQRPERDSWLASLPVGGVDGSLRKRFKNLPGADRIHAKTGSLAHVSTLSGYLQARSGKWIIFSFMVNGEVNDKGDVQNFLQQSFALFLNE
jgi:D-alanyl-D-alanine carboxypeptidase/D-alanyl-D-alanine-endopeptidase (penicillin-binding protein 4)